MQTDPIGYKDDMDLYSYVGNDPLNKTDPTGTSIVDIGFLISDVADFASAAASGDVAGMVTSAAMIGLDAQPIPGVSAAAHAVSAAVKVEKVAVKAEKISAKEGKGLLPKPPTGPGQVPKAERDPKRLFTPAEREAKRAEQGHNCANGCGTKIDESNSAGHHIDRHADGGATVPENHAEVCIECHKDLHSGGN